MGDFINHRCWLLGGGGVGVGVLEILESQQQKASLGWFAKVSKLFPYWWKLNSRKTSFQRTSVPFIIFPSRVDTFS